MIQQGLMFGCNGSNIMMTRVHVLCIDGKLASDRVIAFCAELLREIDLVLDVCLSP